MGKLEWQGSRLSPKWGGPPHWPDHPATLPIGSEREGPKRSSREGKWHRNLTEGGLYRWKLWCFTISTQGTRPGPRPWHPQGATVDSKNPESSSKEVQGQIPELGRTKQHYLAKARWICSELPIELRMLSEQKTNYISCMCLSIRLSRLLAKLLYQLSLTIPCCACV